MTLDEAIVHCEDVAQQNETLANQYSKKEQNHPVERWDSCEKCASEHRQLAEWLKELKAYKKQDSDAISRKSIKQKLQEHHDFFVNAYGGFSNLPQNDKSRVDEITNCIAMVVNEPPVTPQQKIGQCKDCKWWKDSDGTFRRGIGAESKCPINHKEVYEGNGYCFLFEPKNQSE